MSDSNLNIDNMNQGLFIAILIGLTMVFYVAWIFFKEKSRKTAIAIVGLSGSGKTQLFSRLCHNVDVISVTSAKESHGYFSSNSRNISIYDVPGHERIRYVIFDKLKHQLKSLIFLLDASTIQEDIRDAAEYLYTIFCDGTIQNSRPHVLIACNKQDLSSAKGAKLIQSSLEKEMNLLRITKSNQLKSVGEGGNNNTFLGNPDQDFDFSQLKPIKVTFAECIAAKGAQIEDITAWISRIM